MKGAVWGTTMERARMQLWQIAEEYELIGIKIIKKVNSSSSAWIKFENGDIWQAVKSSESSRGIKVNVSYIDYAIPEEFVNVVIKPCTMVPPFQAINYYWTREDD